MLMRSWPTLEHQMMCIISYCITILGDPKSCLKRGHCLLISFYPITWMRGIALQNSYSHLFLFPFRLISSDFLHFSNNTHSRILKNSSAFYWRKCLSVAVKQKIRYLVLVLILTPLQWSKVHLLDNLGQLNSLHSIGRKLTV